MRINTAILFLLFTVNILFGQTPRLVVPIGHTEEIRAVAFASNGQFVLTGSQDRSAILWNIDGREIQSFKGHEDVVNSVAFSPDNLFALTGSKDISARLWNINTGVEILKITGHAEEITAVAFSPKGEWILTGSLDRTVRMWNTKGDSIRIFTGHTGGITGVAFSTDGKWILTASRDSTAKLWDLKNGKLLQTFTGHTGWVSSAVFSRDDKWVLTSSADKTARLWDANNGTKEKLSFTGHTDRVNSAVFSSNSKYVLSSSDDRSARLWSVAGDTIRTFKGHTGYVYAAVFSPDADLVLTASEDKTARLWDVNNIKETLFLAGHSSSVKALAWAPGGSAVLTGHADHKSRLWELSQREVPVLTGHTDEITSVAFSKGGDSILTASLDKTAKLWNRKGKPIQTLSHSAAVSAAVFSPKDQTVLTGSRDGSVMHWESNERGTPLFQRPTQNTAVAFAPDGGAVLVGGQDGVGLLWNLATGKFLPLRGHFTAISSVAFSPDGTTMITGSQDRTAMVWNVEGDTVMTLRGHKNWVNSVAFSPPTPEAPLGGEYFLTGSRDNTAKLWNYTGEDMRTFNGHSARVNAVAFSPDGKFVLTGSSDNTAKIWDRRTAKELLTLVALEDDNWVVTDTSGLFDASPGAMNLMYFVTGQEVIDLEQLKERYYEPGLLAKIMGFSNELLRSVAGFDSVALYPDIKLTLDTVKHLLRISLSPRHGGMGKVSVFINNNEIFEDALYGKGLNRTRDTLLTIKLEPHARLFIPGALNTVWVRAYNRENWLRSPIHSVAYSPDFVGSKGADDQGTSGVSLPVFTRSPALYLLLVGVADYAGTDLDLKYTAKDAKDMASALQQAGGQLFRPDSVFVHVLTTNPGDRQPTRANIKAAFDVVAARAKAEDIFLAYFSGHGTNYGDAEKALFYFLSMETGSFDLSDAGVRNTRAISSDSLTRWINLVPAQKKVLIVDACNSGKVAEDIMRSGGKSLNASQTRALDRMQDRTGMFILSGSAADQKSFEAGGFRQSLLTYSLLEAMKNGEALTPEQDVDVMRLFQHARTRVPVLAESLNKIQVPVPAFPKGGSTIFIGRVNEAVQIPLEENRNVFIPSTFQHEDRFDDPLGLTTATDKYLLEQDAEGGSFTFVDMRNYANAYALKGLYKLENNTVTLRWRLFKGKEPLGELQTAAGEKDKVNELVEGIVKRALRLAR